MELRRTSEELATNARMGEEIIRAFAASLL
jgi:hypothetical protein